MNWGEGHDSLVRRDLHESDLNLPLSPAQQHSNIVLLRNTPPPSHSYLRQQDLSQRSVSSFASLLSPVRVNKPIECGSNEPRVPPWTRLYSHRPITPFERAVRRAPSEHPQSPISHQSPRIIESPPHLSCPNNQFYVPRTVPAFLLSPMPASGPETALPNKPLEVKEEMPCPTNPSTEPALAHIENRRSEKELEDSVRSEVKQTKSGKKRKFPCEYCKKSFMKAQGLGGHMSRKHPGLSKKYKYKTQVRDERAFERAKLLLAKKKYYSTLNYDYEDLIQTAEGKFRARVMMNRSQVKKLKNSIQHTPDSFLFSLRSFSRLIIEIESYPCIDICDVYWEDMWM